MLPNSFVRAFLSLPSKAIYTEDTVGLVYVVISIGSSSRAGPRFAIITHKCVGLFHPLAAPGADAVFTSHVVVVVCQGVGHLRTDHVGAFPSSPGAADCSVVASLRSGEYFSRDAPSSDVFQEIVSAIMNPENVVLLSAASHAATRLTMLWLEWQ